MDKLDKLKENWQSEEHELPKVSFDKIYKMLLKKSSSIVKWIFVISVIELLFWISLYFSIARGQYEYDERTRFRTSYVLLRNIPFFYIWYFHHLIL